MSFTVRAGEIVGLAGLLGSGRTEILDMLSGSMGRTAGTVRLLDREVAFKHPADAIIAGMARVRGPLARLARPRWVNAFFRKSQLLSAGYMGFAHGSNDAQKTMGVIALALVLAAKAGQLTSVPAWLDFHRPPAGSLAHAESERGMFGMVTALVVAA